jgi:HEXXH motif-containing protein
VLPIGELSTTRLHRDWLFDRVGRPADGVAEELTSRGFHFASHLDDFAPTLKSAAQLLAPAPSLERAVAGVVREIILLDAPAGYDISHSEPRWPETIFVSASLERRQVAGLRALENIVHEAMHLQLTMLEQTAPLVADETTLMASPWRAEPRHLQGVLHGAYVFRCISTFFGLRPLRDRLDEEGADYVVKRTQEIAEELNAVDFDQLTRGLTLEGRAVAEALF